MGRGLGETQKGVLGVAFTVNAHTQGGVAGVKSTVPGDDRRLPDFTTDLGMFVVYGLTPDPKPVTRVDPRGWESTYDMYDVLWSAGQSPEARRARVAVCKAVATLRRRGLMTRYGSDHVLTAAGLELGRVWAVDVPEIDLALEVFLGRGRSSPGWKTARDALLARLRSAPLCRPVEVDQAGNVRTPGGEPVVRPGLTPDRVLEGIAEEAAGRMRPLAEVIARRGRDGV
jgi:hypothetical protein